MKRHGILLLAGLAAAAAQTDDSAFRRMIESKRQVTDYLVRAAREVTDRAEREINSVESWEKVRAKRLSEMRDMLGLLPWPERTQLNVKITGVLDQGSYTIEKIAFESMPKVYVTANLYLPKTRAGQLPAVTYVCGHSFSEYGDKTKYQHHGISLAKNGYAAFVLDSIQIAETLGLHHGVSGQEMYDWYSRGYTPAGVEVWNAMRAIDYLETRPEIDKARIGMTGRSGGAAMSWFTAAVDPRVKVVAPVMGISTYAANLREDTQRHHCDCMFTVNLHMHDMIHQGALIAPRPLLMAHGSKDVLFPIAGYEEFYEKVGALYKAYGQGDDFRNIVVETEHKDSDYLREQVIRWFDKYLMKIPERQLDMTYTALPEASLAVFGGKPPADARNYRIQETFTTRTQSGPFRSLAAWEKRRTELLETLRTQVFATAPVGARQLKIRKATREEPGSWEEIEFSSEEGIQVRAVLRKPSSAAAKGKLPALLYVASDTEDPGAIRELLRGVYLRDTSVRMAVYPRGVGEVPWDKTFWKGTLRNAMQVGRSVDSMRLADVLAAVDVLRLQREVDPDRITVMGKGVSGALGLYAAILDPKIQQVLLLEPPESHVTGPIFLGILRHTDLPEAAALLAPRRLNFYSRMPKAYEYSRDIYSLYGKRDHVFVTMSIEGILEGKYDHGFSSGL